MCASVFAVRHARVTGAMTIMGATQFVTVRLVCTTVTPCPPRRGLSAEAREQAIALPVEYEHLFNRRTGVAIEVALA